MAMTLTEMRDEVRNNIKRAVTAFPDARLTLHVNWAQAAVADVWEWEEMFTTFTTPTVASQKRYATPTQMKNALRILLIDGTNSYPLTYYRVRTFDALSPYPEGDTEARPTIYLEYGAYFELLPIPDAEYTVKIRCTAFPTDLSADDDESSLLRKDRLIVAVATAISFRSLRLVEDAVYWDGEANALLSLARAADHSGVDWQPYARGFGEVMSMPSSTHYLNPLTALE